MLDLGENSNPIVHLGARGGEQQVCGLHLPVRQLQCGRGHYAGKSLRYVIALKKNSKHFFNMEMVIKTRFGVFNRLQNQAKKIGL